MTNCPESLDDFLAFLDQASQANRAREAAYREWLGQATSAIAEHLTETMLPADMRAAGIRIEWAEER